MAEVRTGKAAVMLVVKAPAVMHQVFVRDFELVEAQRPDASRDGGQERAAATAWPVMLARASLMARMMPSDELQTGLQENGHAETFALAGNAIYLSVERFLP